MKIVAVIDGKPGSNLALHRAAEISRRLAAELTVITVRAGTHATETPPPLGRDISLHDHEHLPEGIQILLRAADQLHASGLLAPFKTVRLRDLPHGHVFFAQRADGEPIAFSEHFGNLIDTLNHELAENKYDLVVLASPRRSVIGRWAALNVPRKLALDLHGSFLIVRGGTPDSRYVVCADGSPSSRRIFPFLKMMLPAIRGPVDLVCAQKPAPTPQETAQAEHCLNLARNWLTGCGKTVRVLRPRGPKPHQLILDAAGSDAVIVMGESHLHDVRRRTLGTLPLKVLPRTDASFLLVKQPTEPDPEMFEESFTCE